MPTLEEITYDAARDALAEQEAFVAGIRQRTGTLLAAHALVATFLGSPVLRDEGPIPLAWPALAALVAGLAVGGALLGPWALRFAVDAESLYETLRDDVTEGAADLGWLVSAAYLYRGLHGANTTKVNRMSRCSGALAGLMILQTLAWLLTLAVS